MVAEHFRAKRAAFGVVMCGRSVIRQAQPREVRKGAGEARKGHDNAKAEAKATAKQNLIPKKDKNEFPQEITLRCFLGCTGPYTLGPCLRKILRICGMERVPTGEFSYIRCLLQCLRRVLCWMFMYLAND